MVLASAHCTCHPAATACPLLQADLLRMPKFGERKAAKMLADIDASRRMDLVTLLTGLGIECVLLVLLLLALACWGLPAPPCMHCL
jgi:hypothetical protein